MLEGPSDVQNIIMDVAAALEAMSQAVGRGDFQEARDIGNSATIPLGISSSDVQLGALLHETPHSSVFKGQYKGQDVAVKRCKISKASDLLAFRQEVALISQLDHPGIVRLLAVKALPPDYLMVVPLEAGNLSDALHERAWRPCTREVLRLALQLAEACAHMHSRGIVHRDVKPANVLLGVDGRAKLTDFGIAELAATLADDSAARSMRGRGSKPTGGFHKRNMVGTLEYMAPEVLLKQPGSVAADVYAFAVTLNELVSGVYPFSDCTRDNPKAHTILDMGYGRQELAAAVVGEGLRPLPPPGLPAPLQSLLDACWAADPQQRPAFEHVAAELRRMRDGLAVFQQPMQNGRNESPRQSAPDGGSAAPVTNGQRSNGAAGVAAQQSGAANSWTRPPWADGCRGAKDCSVQVSAGVYETAGRRGEDCMEDRHALQTGLGGDGSSALLALFDGHRGHQAAEYAAQHFEAVLLQRWGSAASAAAALSGAFVEVDAAFRKSHAGVTGPHQWAGCTALAALVWRGRLYVANAGDCRAVLCRAGAAEPVSRDHTADLDAERQRVLDAGGTALQRGGTWRIGEVGLQVTRSMGDGDLKEFGVTADPEITEYQLTADDSFLILASDGLWDVMSNHDAIGLVHDTVKQPTMCAQRLATEALTRGSTDNITVVVAFLHPVESLELIFSDGQQKYSATYTHYGSRNGSRNAAP